MKKTAYLALAAISLFGTVSLTGCQADMDAPSQEAPVATLTPNTTILELKNEFADQTAQVGLKENGEHYIIHGRVISSDASGNIYQSIVIQDETAALAFSVRKGNMSAIYPYGQELVIDMTGLYMGYYSGLQQVGWPDEPYNGQPQVGFMAWAVFEPHVQVNGYPSMELATVGFDDPWPADKMYMILPDMGNLPGGGEEMRRMQSQLVEFRNVSFKDAGKERFSRYQISSFNTTIFNVENPSETVTVSTSGYCNFYDDILPEGVGSVRGILSYYSSSYQLKLRDRADVNITTKGTTKEDAYTVDEVIGGEYAGMTGWTTGYIVGSVRAGVDKVTSADNVIFGPDAELDNNLLIALNPGETDFSKCVCINLPQDSKLRTYGNLADNPEVYKKQIWVNGTLSTYLGLPGVTNIAGTTASFEIEGIDPDAPVPAPDPKGSGTEADPYNIGYVMRSTANETGVWVTGYVAGYVASFSASSGNPWSNTAEWSANAVTGSSNYLNSTNVILSEVVAGKAVSGNSVPAGLTTAVKPTLGLKNNPSVFGKKVVVKCNISEYMGVRAIRNISEVKILN